LIIGTVDGAGLPIVMLTVAGQSWPALVDTGFNGDLELPEAMRPLVPAQPLHRIRSLLAGGVTIEEDSYRVDFPFDGQTIIAEATFTPGGQILIGTHLLRHHRLEIDFASRIVRLERLV
jgi:predicted aspartyl protease